MAIITLNNRSINRSDTASSGQVWTATTVGENGIIYRIYVGMLKKEFASKRDMNYQGINL